MAFFEIVAHRGIASQAPENTLAAFRRAIELGADAVEFDVRLTADRIPVVYHYYYLDRVTTGVGPIFNYTLAQLRKVDVHCRADPALDTGKISTLAEVMDFINGRIGMEIEIKGPEPEAPDIIAGVLCQFKSNWDNLEITSYQPSFMLDIQRLCPGLKVDLLFPRSESWMKLDVVAYQAIHHSRLAHARAVHLHPTQLSADVVAAVKNAGIQIHAWDVNDEAALDRINGLGILRIDTDEFQQAFQYRFRVNQEG